MSWSCPYCGNPAATPSRCGVCGRDPSAPRRICGACKRMTPKVEPACCHCGAAFTHELAWKLPVVVVVIILATVLQFVLRGLH